MTGMLYNIPDYVLVGGSGLLLAPFFYIGYKLIKMLAIHLSRFEWKAEAIIRDYDTNVFFSFEEMLKMERLNSGFPLVNGIPTVEGARQRFRPRRSYDLAYSLAYEAYLEFGHRPRSDANLLITRKFMRDMIKECKDLRAKDAGGIIDTALYLSFLPSRCLREMNEIDDTYAFKDRRSDRPGQSPWWWPFGGPAKA